MIELQLNWLTINFMISKDDEKEGWNQPLKSLKCHTKKFYIKSIVNVEILKAV